MAEIINRGREFWPGKNIAVCFERQDQFSTRSQSIYDVYKHNGRWCEIKSFQYADKYDVDFLQAADLIAWEIRRYFWKDSKSELNDSEYPLIRRLIGRAEFNPGHIGTFLDEESLKVAMTQVTGVLEIPPTVAWT